MSASRTATACAMKPGSESARKSGSAAMPAATPSTVPRRSCRSQRRSPLTGWLFSAEAFAACQYWCASAVCCASRTARIRATRPRRASMGGDSTPRLFRQAFFQPGDEEVARQLLADEHEDRLLLLGLRPRLAHVAAHHHV